MEKIIPRGIDYSDIRPEAIENSIKLVRFTPTATVNNAKPNDIIRFQLLGNGFYDPYSAYLLIEVTCLGNTNPVVDQLALGSAFAARLLDRSAHSIIGRLVIKSQGTELERIEQYDVAAAMINDMIYNNDQAVLHHYEGFACKSADLAGPELCDASVVLNGNGDINNVFTSNDYVGNLCLSPLVHMPYMNEDLEFKGLIDQGFWGYRVPGYVDLRTQALADTNADKPGIPSFLSGASGNELFRNGDIHNYTYLYEPATGTGPEYAGDPGAPLNVVPSATLPGQIYDIMANGGYIFGGVGRSVVKSPDVLEFCIPIYSGIIGVLQPDKKMLPLSLMPLEIEFTMNPYAFYDVGGVLDVNGVPIGLTNPRDYTVSKFWLYTHVLYFEQELHRSLESVVAESGIFLHFISFYLAPICTHNTESIQNYAQINIHAKSIQSVHFVFIYSGFEPMTGTRKLHFNNHNLEFLQIRNGTELTPSEAVEGDQSGKKAQNNHVQYLLETYKAYNKMHDPTTESMITPFNYTYDYPLTVPTNFYQMIMQQAQLGRCQYGISLQGEELGEDQSIISGKKGLIPFDINMNQGKKNSSNASFEFIFVKADYIVYVRPDLVVTLLGR